MNIRKSTAYAAVKNGIIIAKGSRREMERFVKQEREANRPGEYWKVWLSSRSVGEEVMKNFGNHPAPAPKEE